MPEQQTQEARPQVVESPVRSVEKAGRTLAAGFSGEAFAGLAATVLAIIALAPLIPVALMSITGIVIGAAMLCVGSAILSQFNRVASGLHFGQRARIEAGSAGLFFGGIAGIVLSVIALLGKHTVDLIGITSLVYGAALIVSSPATYSIDMALPWRDSRLVDVVPAGRGAAAGTQALVGCAAIILGIISLSGMNSVRLNIVSMLCIGLALALAGSLTGARFYKRF